jgi:hypothetical protein
MQFVHTILVLADVDAEVAPSFVQAVAQVDPAVAVEARYHMVLAPEDHQHRHGLQLRPYDDTLGRHLADVVVDGEHGEDVGAGPTREAFVHVGVQHRLAPVARRWEAAVAVAVAVGEDGGRHVAVVVRTVMVHHVEAAAGDVAYEVACLQVGVLHFLLCCVMLYERVQVDRYLVVPFRARVLAV